MLRYISDWTKINSARALKSALLAECEILRATGKGEIADRWVKNIARMPKKINKENINLILFMACNEVKKS